MKEFQRNIDDKTVINYRLGTNAKENHQLIDEADDEDWWFHLESEPSGHCIVERIEIDNSDVIFASQIVKDNSSRKNKKSAPIIYTQIKNIKKTKNPGEVKILDLKKLKKFTLIN